MRVMNAGASVPQEYTLAEPLWDEEMMDAVARMCCTWWERKAPCREDLVARAIPYVLVSQSAEAGPFWVGWR